MPFDAISYHERVKRYYFCLTFG